MANSDWIKGEETRLTLIAIAFQGVFPAFSYLIERLAAFEFMNRYFVPFLLKLTEIDLWIDIFERHSWICLPHCCQLRRLEPSSASFVYGDLHYLNPAQDDKLPPRVPRQ